MASWIVVYPIYLDAKRPHRAGARRVPSSIALQWPTAFGIAQACKALRIDSVFEVRRMGFHLRGTLSGFPAAEQDASEGLGQPWEGTGVADERGEAHRLEDQG